MLRLRWFLLLLVLLPCFRMRSVVVIVVILSLLRRRRELPWLPLLMFRMLRMWGPRLVLLFRARLQCPVRCPPLCILLLGGRSLGLILLLRLQPLLLWVRVLLRLCVRMRFTWLIRLLGLLLLRWLRRVRRPRRVILISLLSISICRVLRVRCPRRLLRLQVLRSMVLSRGPVLVVLVLSWESLLRLLLLLLRFLIRWLIGRCLSLLRVGRVFLRPCVLVRRRCRLLRGVLVRRLLLLRGIRVVFRRLPLLLLPRRPLLWVVLVMLRRVLRRRLQVVFLVIVLLVMLRCVLILGPICG